VGRPQKGHQAAGCTGAVLIAISLPTTASSGVKESAQESDQILPGHKPTLPRNRAAITSSPECGLASNEVSSGRSVLLRCCHTVS